MRTGLHESGRPLPYGSILQQPEADGYELSQNNVTKTRGERSTLGRKNDNTGVDGEVYPVRTTYTRVGIRRCGVQKTVVASIDGSASNKTKIENRDEKENVKKSKYSDEDWWIESGQSPEKFQEWIYKLGIRDVASFLDYAARYIPQYKFGAFICDQKRHRLVRQINDELRRRYSCLSWWEACRTRRQQFQDRRDDGTTYNLEESTKLLERILQLNKIPKAEFLNTLFSVIEKKHQKKNSLYLQGPSNSMKSTVATSIRCDV
jgi:hypothetical protein